MKSITHFWGESQTPHFIPKVFAIIKGVAYMVVHIGTTSHFKLFLIRVCKGQGFIEKPVRAGSLIASTGCHILILAVVILDLARGT